MDARLARMEMATDATRASTSLARAGRPSRVRESRTRARTVSCDGGRDEDEDEDDVRARGRRGKGNRSRWLI